MTTNALPRMTDARRRALAEAGITSHESLLEWCAERLAGEVNQRNERTRTKPEHARAWMRTSAAALSDDQPERLDPHVDDNWDDDAVFSVHYQFRDETEAGSTEDGLERSLLVVNHYGRDIEWQRWPGWDVTHLMAWLRPSDPSSVQRSPGSDERSHAPEEGTDPRSIAGAPTARDADSERTYQHQPDRPVERASRTSVSIAAITDGGRIPIDGESLGRPIAISRRAAVEIDLGDETCEDVHGTMWLVDVTGAAAAFPMSGRSRIRSTELDLAPGYYEGHVLLTVGSSHTALPPLDLRTILIKETTP